MPKTYVLAPPSGQNSRNPILNKCTITNSVKNFEPDRLVFEPNFCMSKPYEEFLQMKFIFKGKLKMLRKT